MSEELLHSQMIEYTNRSVFSVVVGSNESNVVFPLYTIQCELEILLHDSILQTVDVCMHCVPFIPCATFALQTETIEKYPE